MDGKIEKAKAILIACAEKSRVDMYVYVHICEYLALMSIMGDNMSNAAMHYVVANARYLEHFIDQYYEEYVINDKD